MPARSRRAPLAEIIYRICVYALLAVSIAAFWLGLGLLLAQAARAATPAIYVPFRWQVDTARPARQDLPITIGETVALEPYYVSYGQPVDLANCDEVLLRYRSADMAAGLYHAITGEVVNATNGSVRIIWRPEHNGTNTLYSYDIMLSGTNSASLKAAGRIRLSGGISGTPTNVPAIHLDPIDWALVRGHLNPSAAPFLLPADLAYLAALTNLSSGAGITVTGTGRTREIASTITQYDDAAALSAIKADADWIATTGQSATAVQPTALTAATNTVTTNLQAYADQAEQDAKDYADANDDTGTDDQGLSELTDYNAAGNGITNIGDLEVTGESQIGDASTDNHGINTAPVANQGVTEAFSSTLTDGSVYGTRLSVTRTPDPYLSGSDAAITYGQHNTVTDNSSGYGQFEQSLAYGTYNDVVFGGTPDYIGWVIDQYGTYNKLSGNLGVDFERRKYSSYSYIRGTAVASYGFYADVSGATANYSFYGASGDFYQNGAMEVTGGVTADSYTQDGTNLFDRITAVKATADAAYPASNPSNYVDGAGAVAAIEADSDYTNTVALAAGALSKSGGTMTGPITGLTDLSGSGRRVFGSGLSATNIAITAYGASQSGDNLGTQTIGIFATGASQSGYNTGTRTIGNYANGASQIGYNNGTQTIGANAHGASQQGYIASNTATATNNASGAIQLHYLTGGQHALTTSGGLASILLGAGISSNKYAIVAGDGAVSHGDGSITASGGFYGASVEATGTVEAASYALTGNRRAVPATTTIPTNATYTISSTGAFERVYGFAGTNAIDITLTGPGAGFRSEVDATFTNYTDRTITWTNNVPEPTFVPSAPTSDYSRVIIQWDGTNSTTVLNITPGE